MKLLQVNDSGWTLINDIGCWDLYQKQVADSLDQDADQIEWGPPPAVVPCLVASIIVRENKVFSSYVFPRDARTLMDVVRQSEPKPMSMTESVPSVQAEHNKSMVAHVLATAKILVDTGIITEEQYMARHNAMLAYVDQAAAEVRDFADMLKDQRDTDQVDKKI